MSPRYVCKTAKNAFGHMAVLLSGNNSSPNNTEKHRTSRSCTYRPALSVFGYQPGCRLPWRIFLVFLSTSTLILGRNRPQSLLRNFQFTNHININTNTTFAVWKSVVKQTKNQSLSFPPILATQPVGKSHSSTGPSTRWQVTNYSSMFLQPWSLYALTEHHAMKAYLGSAGTAPLIFFLPRH